MIAAIYALFSLVGNIFNSAPVKMLLWRGMLLFLLCTIMPIVLNNFFHHILQVIINSVNAQAGYLSLSNTLQFTGITAYLATLLKIPQGVSILLGAVSSRFCLRLLRMG